MRRRFPQLMRRKGARWTAGAVAFQPSSLASVAHFWEADSGTNEAASDPCEDGDGCQIWEPVIGSANFVQSSAGIRPVWNEDGGPNNLPYLEHLSGRYMDATISAMSPPFHVFHVCYRSVWGNNIMHFDGISTDRAAVYGTGGVMRQYQTSLGASHTFPTDGEWMLLEALFAGDSSSYIRYQDSSAASGDCGTDTWVNPRLGASQAATLPFNGRTSAFLIATSQISGTDLTNLRSWFGDKYGVTV